MTRPASERQRVKRLAARLHQEFGDQIPVDVEALAKARAIDIRFEDLEDEVSGMLVVRDDQAVIGVNIHHHPNRRRFTLAHELGHYLLHRDDAQLFIDAAPVFFRSENGTISKREQELAANWFAAELLMPESVVRQMMDADPIDVFDDVSVRKMADRFGVSSQALLIRLAELELTVPQF